VRFEKFKFHSTKRGTSGLKFSQLKSDYQLYIACQSFKGRPLTPERVDAMSDAEIEELYARYEVRLGAAMSKCLGSSLLRLYASVVDYILLYYAGHMKGNILFDTGVGNKRRLIAVADIAACVGKDVCNALLGLHAFTGCDCTSAFVRKGKKRPYILMKSDHHFLETMQGFGSNVDNVSQSITLGVHKFVCANRRVLVCFCRCYAAPSVHRVLKAIAGVQCALTNDN